MFFSFAFGFNHFNFPKRKQLLNSIYIISPFRHFVILPFRVLNTPVLHCVVLFNLSHDHIDHMITLYCIVLAQSAVLQLPEKEYFT